jgi:hypothetical protein
VKRGTAAPEVSRFLYVTVDRYYIILVPTYDTKSYQVESWEREVAPNPGDRWKLPTFPSTITQRGSGVYNIRARPDIPYGRALPMAYFTSWPFLR